MLRYWGAGLRIVAAPIQRMFGLCIIDDIVLYDDMGVMEA
jgi:hypothetical protein